MGISERRMFAMERVASELSKAFRGIIAHNAITTLAGIKTSKETFGPLPLAIRR